MYSNQPERAGKQINQNALKQIKAVEKEIIILFDSLMVLIAYEAVILNSINAQIILTHSPL